MDDDTELALTGAAAETPGPLGETEVVQAWGLCEADELDEPTTHASWGAVWSTAATVFAVLAMVATAIAVSGWVWHRVNGDPMPPLPTAAEPTLSAVPTSTPEAPTSAVVAAPPATATITVTATPTLIAAPPPIRPSAAAPSQSDLDERFLMIVNRNGMFITDTSALIQGGRGVCTYLKAGHTRVEAMSVALTNNASLTADEAAEYVDAAIAVYCPQYTHE